MLRDKLGKHVYRWICWQTWFAFESRRLTLHKLLYPNLFLTVFSWSFAIDLIISAAKLIYSNDGECLVFVLWFDSYPARFQNGASSQFFFCFLTITHSFLISPSHPHRRRHHKHPRRAWILNCPPTSTCLSFINIGGWVFNLPVGEGGGASRWKHGGIWRASGWSVTHMLYDSCLFGTVSLDEGESPVSAAQGGNTPTGSVKALSHAAKWSQA